MASWNPWHGCHKYSEGCMHCYVYRSDARYGKDSRIVTRLKDFDLPIRKNRQGMYKLAAGEIVYTCFTSDFFVEGADAWREEAWQMIKTRSDLHFFMITKRIDRVMQQVPEDWGDGYPNVTICCTMENQKRVDERMPYYKAAKIAHKQLICEPLLEAIDVAAYLDETIEQVTCGGESGLNARLCDYDWVLHLREQCIAKQVPFFFKQTGAYFRKDGIRYHIARRLQHPQARKADIDVRAQYPKFR